MPGARGHVKPPPHAIFGHLTIKPGALKRPSRKDTDMPAVAGNKARGRGRGRVAPGGRQPLPGGGLGNGKPPQAQVGVTGGPGRRGRGGKGGGGIGVGGAAMAGPGGRQLQARVSSGAITSEQAQKTMQQRQTLAKALGPDWREKLSVGGKSFAQVNKQLKANPGNAKLAALRKKLIANRSTLLESARKKNQGGEGEGE